MKQLRVFLMGGTKDSIDIIKFLKKEYDVYILTTTTTEYGSTLAIKGGSDSVIANPLPKEDILKILTEKNFDIFIDATHPFAEHVTQTAIECAKIMKIPYIRFERPTSNFENSLNEKIHLVISFDDAGKLISKKWNEDNVLHLAGANTLKDILKSIPPEKIYPRILNLENSIKKCDELKIPKENIIILNGVSTKEENINLIKKINAKVIISKDSGEVGGVPAKIEAANELGIDIIIIKRPKIDSLQKENIVNNLTDLNLKIQKYLCEN
ncbi:precorrin-6A reductase [Methanobrevibacter sp. OttesenSCG-928-K11]|nr:precorrin-6A reductase [Methanobrevibacter sp. OttesenSCG-928-K11]MDL2270179.1 precorrin-6A reductase [Methanobrevibacter sp. OttesenSCG-928-I08]